MTILLQAFHSMWFDKATKTTVTWSKDEQAAALQGAFIHHFHDVLNPGEIWIHTDMTRLLGNQNGSSFWAPVISHVIWSDEVFVQSSWVEFEAAVIRTSSIVADHGVQQRSSQDAEEKDVTGPHDDSIFFWMRWWRWAQLLFACNKGLLNKRWCGVTFIKIKKVKRKKGATLRKGEGGCGVKGTEAAYDRNFPLGFYKGWVVDCRKYTCG